MFEALAFVLMDDVPEVYEGLVASLSDDVIDTLYDFLGYFEHLGLAQFTVVAVVAVVARCSVSIYGTFVS
jgi:hypothetical protein